MSRRWVAGCVVVLALAVASTGGTAFAKGRGGVDRSFGGGGTVDLGYLVADESFHSIREMTVGPEGGIFISDFETSCAGPGSCAQVLRLIRLNRDGTLDGSYGDGGEARIPAPPNYVATAGIAIDGQGRAVVALSQPGSITVLRLSAAGRVDAAFGGLGSTVLPCDCEPYAAKLGFDSRGGITVESIYTARWDEGRSRERRILAVRLTADGALEPRFGAGGLVDLRVPGYEQSSGIRGDGSIVIASALESPTETRFTRIAADGQVDRRFGGRFLRSFRASGLGSVAPWGGIDLVPGPRGSMVVLGGLEGYPEGFALRVRRDGRLDRSFSDDGFKRFSLRISVAAAGGRGRLVTAGSTTDGLSLQTFDRTGHRDRSVGRGRSLVLASWDGATDLAMQGRRPLLFDNGALECRSYCPPKPKLLRLKALP